MPEPLGDAPRREPFLAALSPTFRREVPFLPLLHGPTPVEPAPALERLARRGGIWAKREDLASPIYGGNKVRRFELLLAEARARGAGAVVTAGGLASTQVLATTLFSEALGLRAVAALYDQPVTHFCRRVLLTAFAHGAELVYGGGYARTAKETLRARVQGERAFLILPGAFEPVANLGYVDAAFEIAEQVKAGAMPRPDVVVVAAGSGGTLAGLSVGFARLGWPTLTVGVRITEPFACNLATLKALTAATDAALTRRAPELKRARSKPRFSLFGGALGRGYGHPTPAAIAGIETIRELTGRAGEVTYSGKAVAGFARLVEQFPRESILFLHTLSSVQPSLRGVGPEALPAPFRRFFEGDVPA